MVKYTRPAGNNHRKLIVAEFEKAPQHPPTYQELADALGFRINTIRHHVNVLIAEGTLARTPGKSRGVHLVRQPSHVEMPR